MGQADSNTKNALFTTEDVDVKLDAPTFMSGAIDFDELSRSLVGLEGKLDKNPKTAVIILAGGSGDRFGREGGKQLVEIAGKPVLTWSAESFDAVGDVGLIVIVCPAERKDEYLKRAIDPFPFVTPIAVAPSGPTRQESAFSGLECVPDEFEFVALHDGARPLVTPQLIEHTIAMVKGNFDADGAVVPDARVKLRVGVTGSARLLGFGSGNPITDESYARGEFTSYRGMALAVLRAGYESGVATLSVSAGDLGEAELELPVADA